MRGFARISERGWTETEGVKEDTSRFSVAVYCLVSPSRRQSDRILFTRKHVLWPRLTWRALNMREKTVRARPPQRSPHAGLTSSFPLWRVAIASSRRKNSGRIGILCYVLHIGALRLFREYIDARIRWFAEQSAHHRSQLYFVYFRRNIWKIIPLKRLVLYFSPGFIKRRALLNRALCYAIGINNS